MHRTRFRQPILRIKASIVEVGWKIPGASSDPGIMLFKLASTTTTGLTHAKIFVPR
jgi:hypothetical protein